MAGKIAKIYACGGAGTNTCLSLEKYHGQPIAGLSQLDISYIDTSRSNLKAAIPDDRVYVLEGVDGSGKKRDANYQEISARSREILLNHKPGDINLVVHSCSGGKLAFC